MKVKLPLKGPEAEARWRRHVDQQRASGLTKKAYCNKHQMPDHALDYWINKFAKLSRVEVKESSKRFIAAEVGAPSGDSSFGKASASSVLRVILPDGTRIEASGGDMSSLAALAAMMRGRTAP